MIIDASVWWRHRLERIARVLRRDFRRGQRRRVPVKAGIVVASETRSGHRTELVRGRFRRFHRLHSQPRIGFRRIFVLHLMVVRWRGRFVIFVGIQFGLDWRWRCCRRCCCSGLFSLLLTTRPVFVVRMVLHVFHAKTFGLLNARCSFGWSKRFPFFAWNNKKCFCLFNGISFCRSSKIT